MARGAVAIVGAGPAGLAAALFLNRIGREVLILERFDAPRPVGSGLLLQPTGLAILAALGLEPAIRAHGRPITRMFGRSVPADRIVLDVRYAALGAGAAALAVHRSALFGVLHEAVRGEGIAMETSFDAAGLDRCSDGRLRVVDAEGRGFGPFDLVVDAAGAHSPLAARCGPLRRRELPFGALWASLPWPEGAGLALDTLEQRYRGAGVMVGVLPVGRRWGEDGETATFFWSLKPDRYAGWRTAGLEPWRAEVLRVWPAVEPLLDRLCSPDELVLARYGEHTLVRPYAERLAVIGDAAHATSPQLGQGANMALLDAAALAAALDRHGDVQAALEAYARARRRHVQLYQWLSAVFTPFYQSESRLLPALRDRLLEPVSRLPGMPQLLARLVSGLLIAPLGGLEPPSARAPRARAVA